MFSALPLRADIAQCGRHVRFVPISEVIKLIRTPAGYDGVSHPINPQACELVHNHLRSSGTEYGRRRDQAMTQQSAKRIPQWLTIDSLVIVVGLAVIGIGIWIAP